MAADAHERSGPRRSRGPRVLRFLYGGGLFAIGACLGVVIGSLSETPRLLLERLRGPIETLDVAAPAPEEPTLPEPAAAPLQRFTELQEGKPPAPPAKRVEPPQAREGAPHTSTPTPEPTPPPVATAPPPAPKPAAPPAATPAPSVSGRPVVQVASQIDRKAADDMVAKLRGKGFDAYVGQPSAQNGRFRVRVRPQGGETPATLAKRLKTAGYDTWATSE